MNHLDFSHTSATEDHPYLCSRSSGLSPGNGETDTAHFVVGI